MNNWQILTLGAESNIFRGKWCNRDIILKVRPSKPYLLNHIDFMLRKTRTFRESKMITFARSLGIPTPSVYWVDIDNSSIVMEYIEGKTLKRLVDSISLDNLIRFCNHFGRLLATLHNADTIHGDPTTSNVIIDCSDQLWLIDFGLSERNATIEMKGTDLHLVYRAIETTHWQHQKIMMDSILEGYCSLSGNNSKSILSRMDAIQERGRYH